MDKQSVEYRKRIREQILEMMCNHQEGISLSACARELGIDVQFAARCLYFPTSYSKKIDDLVKDQIRQLRYEDGLTITATAERLGISYDSVNKVAPGRPGKIDNKIIRELVIRKIETSLMTYSDIAKALGWEFKNKQTNNFKADVTRLKRTLGLSPDSNYHRSNRRFVDVETVSKIAHIIGVEPWQAGVHDESAEHIHQYRDKGA